MQLIAYYPNMVGIHGHVHISFMLMQKAKYYVMNREYQLSFFLIRETSDGEN